MAVYRIFTAMMLLCLAMGCATLHELSGEVVQAGKSGKGGVTKTYSISSDGAWEITEAVFRWEKADELHENRGENYVIASSGMQMVAFGTVMGVWIDPVNPITTKVTVVTRHRDKGDMFTRLTAERFFQKFDQGFQLVKRGKKLPFAPP